MVRRIEGASELRADAEQREVVRRDEQQPHLFRPLGAREVVLVEPGRRHVLENAGVLQVLPLGLRDADVVRAHAREVVLHGDELLGVGEGERVEQRRVDDAEDGGRGADAERDGQDGDGREARRLAQEPRGKADVQRQTVPPHPPTRFVEPLLGGHDVAEAPARGSGGVLVAHALGAQRVGFDLQVRVDLGREVVRSSSAAEHGLPPAAWTRARAGRGGSGQHLTRVW